MIRLAAMACGLLCGIGLVLSGLFLPSRLGDLLVPGPSWDPALGVGVLTAAAVAVGVGLLARRLRGPLLGGAFEPVEVGAGWKGVAGGVLFGTGWALSGYVPLTALVAAGTFAPGAVVFLAAVLGGMILHDLAAALETRARAHE